MKSVLMFNVSLPCVIIFPYLRSHAGMSQPLLSERRKLFDPFGQCSLNSAKLNSLFLFISEIQFFTE
jgi:hypothetical protein